MNILSQGRSRQVQTESFASRLSSNRGRQADDDPRRCAPPATMAFTLRRRMGPPRGASPPMRMTASWSRSERRPNTRLWRESSSTRRRAPSDHASVRPLACLILGINLRQPVDRPKTAHPTNLKELVIQPSTELKCTAPLPRGGGPRRRPLGCRNPDRRARSGKRVSPRVDDTICRRLETASARNGFGSKRLLNSSSPPQFST